MNVLAILVIHRLLASQVVLFRAGSVILRHVYRLPVRTMYTAQMLAEYHWTPAEPVKTTLLANGIGELAKVTHHATLRNFHVQRVFTLT